MSQGNKSLQREQNRPHVKKIWPGKMGSGEEGLEANGWCALLVVDGGKEEMPQCVDNLPQPGAQL